MAQQKLDITIMGTAHYFKDEYQSLQSIDQAIEFIVDLKPDIICIESVPTFDSLSLKEVWQTEMNKADQLKDTLALLNHYQEQVRVGADHYSTYDFWNAYYQWYLVERRGDTLGYFSAFQKRHTNSEYGLIVFPAAKKLGIEKLQGMDYREGEDEFLAHNSKVFKKLLFSFKWKPLRVYLKTQKKYRKAEKEGRLIEFINGQEFQTAFSKLIDDIPKRLPKSEEARLVKAYWLNRNEIMAERIVRTAQQQRAGRVLVTVGSAHVTHIKRFLEAGGHSVTTYGETLQMR